MNDGMKMWPTLICVVTGANCSACSSLTHLSADFPIVLKAQEVSVHYSVLETKPSSMRKRKKKS